MEDIVQVIANVGFPIGACIYMIRNNEKFTDVLGDISKSLVLVCERLDRLEDNK